MNLFKVSFFGLISALLSLLLLAACGEPATEAPGESQAAMEQAILNPGSNAAVSAKVVNGCAGDPEIPQQRGEVPPSTCGVYSPPVTESNCSRVKQRFMDLQMVWLRCEEAGNICLMEKDIMCNAAKSVIRACCVSADQCDTMRRILRETCNMPF